jgi:hypothetical protein
MPIGERYWLDEGSRQDQIFSFLFPQRIEKDQKDFLRPAFYCK